MQGTLTTDGVGAAPQGFRKILPKKRSPPLGPLAPLSTPQLVEVVEQVDVFVQLLAQNCLFMPERHRQIEVLNLLHKLILEKKRLIFLNGLRSYEVYLLDLKFGNSSLKTLRQFIAAHFDCGWRREEVAALAKCAQSLDNLLAFEFAPQISVLQCPALEAHHLIEEAIRKGLPEGGKLALLHELAPLFMRQYVPVFCQESRCCSNKFTAAEDALLLIGLIKHSCKRFSDIQAQFLPHKSLKEMRNRYKNLTRQKAAYNSIKGWKIRETEPLTADEQRNLQKGQLWFGAKNFRLIARYFLPQRSEAFLSHHASLLRKRPEPCGESLAMVADHAGLDLAFDYCAESAEAARESQEFIVFLNSFLNDHRSIAGMVPRPATHSHHMALNLSEPKLSFRTFSKRSHRLVELRRDAVASTKIQMRDDHLILSASQITHNEVKHKYLDESAFEADRMVAPPHPGVLRLEPTFKELQSAAAVAVQKRNFSLHSNRLFEKLIF